MIDDFRVQATEDGNDGGDRDGANDGDSDPWQDRAISTRPGLRAAREATHYPGAKPFDVGISLA